jgi:hypothetical protein
MAAGWVRLAVLTLLLAAAPAWGQSEADRATARELAYEGQEAFDRGDFATAADRFARADSLVHAPTLTLALARAQLKLGKVVLAFENYNRILREGVPAGSPAVFQQAHDDAEREVEQARAKLAWVTLQVRGASGPQVILDGDQPVAPAALGVRRAIDPGEHSVRATAAGYLPAETRFKLAEGEAGQVELSLARDPNAPLAPAPGSAAPITLAGPTAPAPGPAGRPSAESGTGSSQRTLGVVMLGAAGAGLVVGSIAGVMAMGKHSDLSDACAAGRCPATEQDTLDSYRTLGAISTVGFAVGAATAVAGVTLLLTAPETPAAGARLGLGLAANRVYLNGAF